jgi:Ca2+-binding EF-hand superfamily protein
MTRKRGGCGIVNSSRPDIPNPSAVGHFGPLKSNKKPPFSARVEKKDPQDLDHFLEELAKKHGHKPKLQKAASARLPPIPVERCSRCTKEEMWAVYDVFRSLDMGRKHRITRKDFFNRDEPKRPTLMELRVLQRSKLDDRFRHSAEDITLAEFLQLMWPGCSQEEIELMMHWARLRDAQSVLREPKFRGEISDLKKVFDLLDEDNDGNLSMAELNRAGILSKQEIDALMQTSIDDNPDECNFEEFVSCTQSHFKDMFVTTETRRAMEQEKEDDKEAAIRNAFASGFQKMIK